MRTFLVACLLLTGLALGEPRTLRASLPIDASTTEQKPVTARLKGKLFDGSVKAFVLDGNQVRVRVHLVNLVGPNAYYSVHAGVFDNQGRILASGGANDVYHEKKKGRQDDEQWDMVIPLAQLKNMEFINVVLYEDSWFLGKR